MRLLTHNVLRSPMKGATDGYPLRIEATDVQVREKETDMGALYFLLSFLTPFFFERRMASVWYTS